MSGVTVKYTVDFWSRRVAERTAVPRVEKKEPARRKQPEGPTYCARLLALAYFLERRLADGSIRSFRHAGEVLGVSHTRAQQILGLINLKPEIQEAVLRGDNDIAERGLRQATRAVMWDEQGVGQ